MDMQWIVGPLVGGAIGYITNGIAIKMLFRPLKPVKIKGITLPFTPGLIPKEKERIAVSIGAVVSNQLLNQDVIMNAFTSDEMKNRLALLFDDFVGAYQASTSTVEEVITSFLSAPILEEIIRDVKSNILQTMEDKLVNTGVGDIIAEAILKNSKEKLQNSRIRIFSSLVDSSLSKSAAHQLGKLVDEMIEEKAVGVAEKLLDDEVNGFLNMPISEFLLLHQNKIQKIRDYAVSLYDDIVRNSLAKILETMDISKVVRERINSFDVLELETIILSIMQKELTAIIWLGAGLGFMMGFVNVILS